MWESSHSNPPRAHNEGWKGPSENTIIRLESSSQWAHEIPAIALFTWTSLSVTTQMRRNENKFDDGKLSASSPLRLCNHFVRKLGFLWIFGLEENWVRVGFSGSSSSGSFACRQSAKFHYTPKRPDVYFTVARTEILFSKCSLGSWVCSCQMSVSTTCRNWYVRPLRLRFNAGDAPGIWTFFFEFKRVSFTFYTYNII